MAGYVKKFIIECKENVASDVTASVISAIKESGVCNGICILQSTSTTAGLMIGSADGAVQSDIMYELRNIAPARYNFTSARFTPAYTSGAIKSAVTGTGLTLIIQDGKLLLSSNQRVILAEFNGPAVSEFVLKIVSD